MVGGPQCAAILWDLLSYGKSYSTSPRMYTCHVLCDRWETAGGPRGAPSGASGAQNNTLGAQNNTPGTQNNTPDAQNNTPDAQNSTPDAQNNTPDAQNGGFDALISTSDGARRLYIDRQALIYRSSGAYI